MKIRQAIPDLFFNRLIVSRACRRTSLFNKILSDCEKKQINTAKIGAHVSDFDDTHAVAVRNLRAVTA